MMTNNLLYNQRNSKKNRFDTNTKLSSVSYMVTRKEYRIKKKEEEEEDYLNSIDF